MIIKKMIKGCGIMVADGLVCGDSIETGESGPNDEILVQPIYCSKCWDKVNALDDV